MTTAEQTIQPAVGYIRVSTGRQRDNFSRKNQRDSITAAAAAHRYQIVEWFEDVQSGSDETREGYRSMLDCVRSGAAHAVFVYKLDRFGRNAREILDRWHEFEHLRVPIISATEGKQQVFLTIGVMAVMAEQYARNLAGNVRDNKERSAREGNHVGLTPFGYDRLPREKTATGRTLAGQLVPNPVAAPIVRELFERADAGWSLRDLAAWLNGNPDCPPSPKGKLWAADGVGFILHNPVYYGYVRFNVDGVGKYERCEPGHAEVVKGKHEAIIDKALFDRVQSRIDAATKHAVATRIAGPLPLAGGVMVCSGCGGPMTISRRQDGSHAAQYVCSQRKTGAAPCESAGYVADLAHAALLDQIDRLPCPPWTVCAPGHTTDDDPLTATRRRLEAEVQELKATRQRHAQRFATVEGELDDDMIAALRNVGEELRAAIKDREAAIAALPPATTSRAELAAFYAEFAHVPLGDLLRELLALGDDAGARALLLKLVDTARVVDRVPANRSRWLRVEVTWSRNVQVAIDAGRLTLADDVVRPDYPSDPIAARRARQRAYHQRKQARASEPPRCPPIL